MKIIITIDEYNFSLHLNKTEVIGYVSKKKVNEPFQSALGTFYGIPVPFHI